MKDQIVELLRHPLAIVATVLLVAVCVQWVIRRAIRKLANDQFLTPNTAIRLRATSRLGIIFLSVLVALQATGAMDEAWAILSATVAALAVGFVASWSLLSNVTSALILLGFRPFRIGDEIEVIEADNVLVRGEVLDLNLFYTTLGDTGAAIRVPNNMLLQRVVRVMRKGTAPDPTKDASEPFFSSTGHAKPEATDNDA